MQVLLDRLHDLVQTETVIGKPIVAGGVTLIPISRVSIGFGAGESAKGDHSNQGGAGGLRVEPLGFVVVADGKAQILPVKAGEPALYRLVDMLPDVWETVRSFLQKDSRAGGEAESDGGVKGSPAR